jgi:phage-related protein
MNPFSSLLEWVKDVVVGVFSFIRDVFNGVAEMLDHFSPVLGNAFRGAAVAVAAYVVVTYILPNLVNAFVIGVLICASLAIAWDFVGKVLLPLWREINEEYRNQQLA